MGETTKISWADHTLNAWIGCTEVDSACINCYAREQNAFFKWNRAGWGAGVPRKRTAPSTWANARKWNAAAAEQGRRARVFCSSLADVFDSEVDPDWRADLFALIAETPALDWLLLTKRPHNLARMLPANWGTGWFNVWLGTTVQDQKAAELRIPPLLAVPARVRFLSVEPMLGPVVLDRFLGLESGNVWAECLCAEISPQDRPCLVCDGRRAMAAEAGLHWVICGGESGPKARTMELAWALSLRAQCSDAGIAFHFKQLGSVLTGSSRDHGYDPARWPAELRIQQFPKLNP